MLQLPENWRDWPLEAKAEMYHRLRRRGPTVKQSVVKEAESEEIRSARATLLSFTRFTKKNYRVNWHHDVLCGYLDRFVAGEIKRLMVFMPPRHGKSELVSRRLPAPLLGRFP